MKYLFFKKTSLKTLTFVSILAALAIILKMLSITIVHNKIIFHNLPIMITSLIFGPFYGILAAILADVASIATTPDWNPLFMIPQIFWGLLPGLFFAFLKSWKIRFLFIIEITTHLVVSAANTLILGIVLGKNVALGTVKIRSINLGITIFNRTLEINFGEIWYLRIVFVFLIMLIKIPIDVYLLNLIKCRLIDKIDLDF